MPRNVLIVRNHWQAYDEYIVSMPPWSSSILLYYNWKGYPRQCTEAVRIFIRARKTRTAQKQSLATYGRAAINEQSIAAYSLYAFQKNNWTRFFRYKREAWSALGAFEDWKNEAQAMLAYCYEFKPTGELPMGRRSTVLPFHRMIFSPSYFSWKHTLIYERKWVPNMKPILSTVWNSSCSNNT